MALESSVIDATDRGLAYGDGLFETMRSHGGTLPWWPRHRARLLDGATRLGIPMPSDARLEAALDDALRASPDGVIKLILTRGAGARGYAPTRGVEPSLIVTSSAPPAAMRDALAVDVLDLRLGVQPALAGMKHLNRLEQVLGAREVTERGLDDGLMADADGFVTCSTRANLLAHLDGRWTTPPVDRAGVAGVARGLLLEAWSPPGGLHVAPLPLADLSRVDALLLTNAVRGILIAHRCGARALDSQPDGLIEARAALAASHPAFRES